LEGKVAKKILFIEDEPDQIMMFKMRLEANGYKVITAMDGEEGLKKVFEEKPDIVLLDVIMPKVDGYEVCRRMKTSDVTSHIPILIISASGVGNAEERCLAAGADDYIRKPCESEDLLVKIKKLIGS